MQILEVKKYSLKWKYLLDEETGESNKLEDRSMKITQSEEYREKYLSLHNIK